MQKTPDDIVIFLLVATAIILLMAGIVVTIILLYRKKQVSYEKDIESIKAEYEKAILNTQLEMQEQTFSDISREIHDNIGMSLTLAKLNLNTLRQDDAAQSAFQVNSSIDLISKAINDLSDISKSLNADFIAEYGLINALAQEINKLKNTGLYEIIFDVAGNAIFLDSKKELVIFRIAQEALNNVLKHANAKKIMINLCYNNDCLDLSISDDGAGFIPGNSSEPTDKKKGSGLINMNKRARMLNGHWIINNGPGNGTIVKLTVPY